MCAHSTLYGGYQSSVRNLRRLKPSRMCTANGKFQMQLISRSKPRTLWFMSKVWKRSRSPFSQKIGIISINSNSLNMQKDDAQCKEQNTSWSYAKIIASINRAWIMALFDTTTHVNIRKRTCDTPSSFDAASPAPRPHHRQYRHQSAAANIVCFAVNDGSEYLSGSIPISIKHLVGFNQLINYITFGLI